MDASVLNDQDKKTRKYWLATAVAAYFGKFLYYFPVLIYVSFQYELNANVALLYFAIPISVIGFAITYHCAYKKYGTSWLTFCMIFTALGIAYLVKDTLALGHVWITHGLLGLLLIANLIDLFIAGLWMAFSLKLRRLNKIVQLQVYTTSEEFQKAVSLIKASTDLDTLEFNYHEAFRECPKHFADALAPHYEQMKKTLRAPAN